MRPPLPRVGSGPVPTAPHADRPAGLVPRPPVGGLYDARFEHDACGVALVADLQGRPSHTLVRQAVSALEHLAHRGATGSEEDSGDGAGILLQVPHDFYAVGGAVRPPPTWPLRHRHRLPVPPAPVTPADARATFEKLAGEEGLEVIGWRDMPIDDSTLGSIAEAAMPSFHQVFVAPTASIPR